MIKKTVITILLIVFTTLVKAQSFEAKIITGFAASQIDGDALAGYSQLGGVFGFSTAFDLSDDIKFEQEIVYYGRGSRANADQAFVAPFTKKGIHYVDLNGIINYAIDDKINLQGGLGYGIPFYINSDSYDKLSDYGGDVFWLIGAGYYLTENIIGVARIQYSLLSIDKRDGAYNNSINLGFRFVFGGE